MNTNSTNIKLSFVIITWNGLSFMRDILGSMTTFIKRKDVEVIVVDNGSEDGTSTYIRKKYPDVMLLQLPENKGVAFARNRGLQISNGDYLFIVDNDMLLNDQSVWGMLDFMEKHPDVGVCGCKLVDSNGVPQESCKCYPGFYQKLRNMLHRGTFQFTYADKMDGDPFEPIYIIGACQLIRREAFEQVGLLDEDIFYGPEDCDFCLRLRKAGWHVIYIPQYTMIHYCQRKTNKHPFSLLGIRHIFALFHLYWKYKRIA